MVLLLPASVPGSRGSEKHFVVCGEKAAENHCDTVRRKAAVNSLGMCDQGAVGSRGLCGLPMRGIFPTLPFFFSMRHFGKECSETKTEEMEKLSESRESDL